MKWNENYGGFGQYAEYVTLYEDSFVLKGYPTPDGRPRYVAHPSEEVGIVSVSDKKEGSLNTNCSY